MCTKQRSQREPKSAFLLRHSRLARKRYPSLLLLLCHSTGAASQRFLLMALDSRACFTTRRAPRTAAMKTSKLVPIEVFADLVKFHVPHFCPIVLCHCMHASCAPVILLCSGKRKFLVGVGPILFTGMVTVTRLREYEKELCSPAPFSPSL